MSTGEESDTNDIVVERETQFVPRSDDDEVLWEVLEITAERGRKYKVKWVGVDPATGKPWAQSWVAKHDCTDKLVAEWKTKQRRLASGKGKTRRGGRTSTTSRASSGSKRVGSSTSGKKTHFSPSEATSSRLDSVEEQPSPPRKKSIAKRKREFKSEMPVPRGTSSGTAQAQDDDDDDDDDTSRPHKKQKKGLEVLLVPPMSSDDDEEPLLLGKGRTKGTAETKGALSKRNGVVGDGSDEDDTSPPKARDKGKGKAVLRSEGRSENAVVVSLRASDAREGSRLSRARAKSGVVRRQECVASADVLSQDEDPGPSTSKKKLPSVRRSPSTKGDEISEEEVEPVVPPIKTGPPRGVKRQDKLKGSGLPRKPGPSRIMSQEGKDCSANKLVRVEAQKGHPQKEVSSSGASPLIQQNTIDLRTPTPPPRISTPQAPAGVCQRSPTLSPGAKARLELFDRMMVEASRPDAAPASVDVPELTDDAQPNYNDNFDNFDNFNTFDLPRLPSPPPSASKPKHSEPDTPNGLVVPETESSQSQPDLLLKPPLPQADKSPKPADLPSIAVITASAAPSPVFPQDLFPPPQKGRTFKPVIQMTPDIFRATIKVRSQGPDSEAPPSSIESFASPKHVDKGKQRAIDDDQLESALSEGDKDSEHQNGITQSRATDSILKQRGKKLFDEALRRRDAERQKKKKAKRLKAVSDIVNGTAPSPFKEQAFPFVSGTEDAVQLPQDGVMDLSGGANSMTLDTLDHSVAKPLSDEERERLRITLRQEEEESTQEAMGIYPLPPVKEPEVINGGDVEMPPPRSPKNSPSNGQCEDGDQMQQRSVDIQLASVIVQASQEQQHEDMDESLRANQPVSSPPRPILDNLTDSPKRRLGEALSLLNVKSEEIQRLERELADERKTLQGLKSELAETQQSSEATSAALAGQSELERAQWSQKQSQWANDLAAWETQRKEWHDEKTSLLARVAELSGAAARAEEASAKLAGLEAERVAWTKERDGILDEATQRSEELVVLTKVREEYDQDRSKWESERSSWAEDRTGWEAERAALQEKQDTLQRCVDQLTATVESATAAKVAADKDREFFREQYAHASGFVGSVREENAELVKRVKIAEGQAQEGVAAIKAMFEGRVKALQADVDRWRGLTELLQEKDRRTNDEVRLRAAQASDLSNLCDRLRTENKSLEADVRKLGQAQQRSTTQRHKLYSDVYVLQKERASLRSRIAQLAKMTECSTQDTSHSAPVPPILEDPEGVDPNDTMLMPDPASQASCVSTDEPGWFPCMWRPQWRDQCQHVFDTKEDLERHLQQHFHDLS